MLPEEAGVGALRDRGLGSARVSNWKLRISIVGEDAQLPPGAVRRRSASSRTTSRANSPSSIGEGPSCAPRPQAKADSAESPSGRFVATAEYS